MWPGVHEGDRMPGVVRELLSHAESCQRLVGEESMERRMKDLLGHCQEALEKK